MIDVNVDNVRQNRYFWLEFLTAWCGGTTVKKLAVVLGLTRETVQRVVIKSAGGFALIRKRGAGLEFDGDISDIKYGPQLPSHALNAISWDATLHHCAGTERQIPVHFEDLSWIATDRGDNENFRAMMSAMARKSFLAVTYRSKKNIMAFEFSPHSIVKTAFRTHFRGYARYEDGKGRYIDIVPGRVVGVTDGGMGGFVGDAKDDEWHARVVIVATAQQGAESVKSALRQELGEFPIKIAARRATARYVKESLTARAAVIVADAVSEPFRWTFDELEVEQVVSY